MVPRHRSPRPILTLGVVAALLLSLVLSVGTVVAADPAVAANPALVPFSLVPGQPGVTTLTFTANGVSGLFACGQDNGNLPTFNLGPVDPTAPSVINFPFIQAGIYTFWVSADPSCDPAKKLAVGGAPVQAQAFRVGPTGIAGQDDIKIIVSGNRVKGELAIAVDQKFPLPDAQICFMSGDGTQVAIRFRIYQGILAAGAFKSTVVMPFAGQNGCYNTPWLVTGQYTASILRSGVEDFLDFCVNKNVPSTPPDASGIGACAQVAFFPDGNSSSVPTGTVVTGAIVTGHDTHAVQVCVSAFSPGPVLPIPLLPNTVNAYNQSGAANLTPLKLAFPSKTAVRVTTYDITDPGKPGGTDGAQFACPTAVATQTTASGGTPISIYSITVSDVPNTTIIDTKTYFIT